MASQELACICTRRLPHCQGVGHGALRGPARRRVSRRARTPVIQRQLPRFGQALKIASASRTAIAAWHSARACSTPFPGRGFPPGGCGSVPRARAGGPPQQPRRLRPARLRPCSRSPTASYSTIPSSRSRLARCSRSSCGHQRQRRPVELRRPQEDVQGQGAIASGLQRGPGPGRQIRGVLARGAGQMRRGLVVVGEHLGVIVRAAQLGLGSRPGPPGRACRPGPPGDLPVGHVAHQHVREGVLCLARDRQGPIAADELAALQLVQLLLQRPPRPGRAARARAPPRARNTFPITAA